MIENVKEFEFHPVAIGFISYCVLIVILRLCLAWGLIVTIDPIFVFSVWALITVFIIIFGEKHRKNRKKLIYTSYALIASGCIAAFICGSITPDNVELSEFDELLANLILISSSAVGANFLVHGVLVLKNEEKLIITDLGEDSPDH